MEFDDIKKEQIVTFGVDWICKMFLMGVRNGAISDKYLWFFVYDIASSSEEKRWGGRFC